MRKVKIRKFKNEDAKEVSALISETFIEFIAKKFAKKAILKFLAEQTPEKQISRAKTRDIFVLTIDKKVVGVIEGTENNRITRLFVEKNYQGKGFAVKLMKKVEKLYRQRGTNKMLLRSSLNAQGFYEKMGYNKSSGLVESGGLIHQPMRKYF